MLGVILLCLLPALVKCSGEGNIHLLEEEVAAAIKSCVIPADSAKSANQRQRRDMRPTSDEEPRIDNNEKSGQNAYAHERRNTSDLRDQMTVLNATDFDYGGYGTSSGGEKFVSTVPRPASGTRYYANNSDSYVNRTKRSEPLLNKPDMDQVDARGIPREAEFWNKVQTAVTSQQSRAALKDQIRACFQELQSEAEDNGCSYSNKLERCLMLRFSDRQIDGGASQPAAS